MRIPVCGICGRVVVLDDNDDPQDNHVHPECLADPEPVDRPGCFCVAFPDEPCEVCG